MGDPPESLRNHPSVEFLADLRDPRLALYSHRRHRDAEECERQERALARRALGLDAAATEQEEAGCGVGVHSGWECLRRLQQAREAGRRVLLQSVLVPSLAPDDLLEVAAGAAPEVFAVEPQLLAAHFRAGAPSGLATVACSFVAAFPVSRPLAALRPPLLVLDGLESSQSAGQVLHAAAHLGVSSVVASPSSWACLDGRAARSSAGWLYHLDYHRAEHLAEALQELRVAGVRTYVADSRAGEPVRPHGPAGDRRWALVVGGEDAGASAAARGPGDARVRVPRRGGGALQAAPAAAICLYELGRHMDP